MDHSLHPRRHSRALELSRSISRVMACREFLESRKSNRRNTQHVPLDDDDDDDEAPIAISNRPKSQKWFPKSTKSKITPGSVPPSWTTPKQSLSDGIKSHCVFEKEDDIRGAQHGKSPCLPPRSQATKMGAKEDTKTSKGGRNSPTKNSNDLALVAALQRSCGSLATSERTTDRTVPSYASWDDSPGTIDSSARYVQLAGHDQLPVLLKALYVSNQTDPNHETGITACSTSLEQDGNTSIEEALDLAQVLEQSSHERFLSARAMFDTKGKRTNEGVLIKSTTDVSKWDLASTATEVQSGYSTKSREGASNSTNSKQSTVRAGVPRSMQNAESSIQKQDLQIPTKDKAPPVSKTTAKPSAESREGTCDDSIESTNKQQKENDESILDDSIDSDESETGAVVVISQSNITPSFNVLDQVEDCQPSRESKNLVLPVETRKHTTPVVTALRGDLRNFREERQSNGVTKDLANSETKGIFSPKDIFSFSTTYGQKEDIQMHGERKGLRSPVSHKTSTAPIDVAVQDKIRGFAQSVQENDLAATPVVSISKEKILLPKTFDVEKEPQTPKGYTSGDKIGSHVEPKGNNSFGQLESRQRGFLLAEKEDHFSIECASSTTLSSISSGTLEECLHVLEPPVVDMKGNGNSQVEVGRFGPQLSESMEYMSAGKASLVTVSLNLLDEEWIEISLSSNSDIEEPKQSSVVEGSDSELRGISLVVGSPPDIPALLPRRKTLSGREDDEMPLVLEVLISEPISQMESTNRTLALGATSIPLEIESQHNSLSQKDSLLQNQEHAPTITSCLRRLSGDSLLSTAVKRRKAVARSSRKTHKLARKSKCKINQSKIDAFFKSTIPLIQGRKNSGILQDFTYTLSTSESHSKAISACVDKKATLHQLYWEEAKKRREDDLMRFSDYKTRSGKRQQFSKRALQAYCAERSMKLEETPERKERPTTNWDARRHGRRSYRTTKRRIQHGRPSTKRTSGTAEREYSRRHRRQHGRHAEASGKRSVHVTSSHSVREHSRRYTKTYANRTPLLRREVSSAHKTKSSLTTNGHELDKATQTGESSLGICSTNCGGIDKVNQTDDAVLLSRVHKKGVHCATNMRGIDKATQTDDTLLPVKRLSRTDKKTAAPAPMRRLEPSDSLSSSAIKTSASRRCRVQELNYMNTQESNLRLKKLSCSLASGDSTAATIHFECTHSDCCSTKPSIRTSGNSDSSPPEAFGLLRTYSFFEVSE